MSASEVYRLQGDLRTAEYALRDLAADEVMAQRAGAWVSSGDYLRSPEGRAVEALRAKVAAAQDAVGGVVYRVPSENVPALTEKLDKLVKRAAKLGVADVTYRVDDEVERVEPVERWNPEDPVVSYAKSYRYVVLNAGVVKLAGWMFLATLTVESGGVMVSKVPAFARAWTLHNEGVTDEAPHADTRDDAAVVAAQSALDAYDLGEYRDAKEATRCDHCHTTRSRLTTYLVENVKTGEVKVVGKNCLRDFLGTDPHRVASYATVLADLEDAMGEGGSGGGRRETLSEEYVTHVCAMLRLHGWAARSAGSGATADEAWSNLRNYGKSEKGKPLYEEVVEADHERAVAAIEWAKEHLGAKVQSGGASDFEHNMFVAANGEFVPKKGDGVLAYLPVAHARFLEREVEQRERAKVDAASEHVGTVGAKLKVTARVLAVFESEGSYGTTFITKLRDDDGNVYKWFGSRKLDLDSVVEATWTVKDHAEYKGVKETVLTRPTGMRDPSVPEPVKPKKVGDKVSLTVKLDDEPVVFEVEKIASGLKVSYGGEVGQARTWKQVESLAADLWFTVSQRRKRAEYLSAGMPDGAGVKRGSYNPYTDYSGEGNRSSRYVQDGEMVALRPKRDGDYSSAYLGEWVPARPPADNTSDELAWVRAEVTPSDSGGTRAGATGPDGVYVPLGEMEVIVKVRQEVCV